VYGALSKPGSPWPAVSFLWWELKSVRHQVSVNMTPRTKAFSQINPHVLVIANQNVLLQLSLQQLTVIYDDTFIIKDLHPSFSKF